MNQNNCTTNPTRIVGKTTPAWKAQAVFNGEFKELSSTDYKDKWKVLFFYPLDFTFVCPTEITAFSDSIQKFKELKCEVIGCSVDSHYSHLAWINLPRNQGGLGKIEYPLLADINKTIATNFGVLSECAGVALRGLFIIDDKDIVQHATINNLGVGRNVEETLRLVEAFQYNAKHGEVCPANWKKGADSMKADPKGSKEWFNKHGK